VQHAVEDVGGNASCRKAGYFGGDGESLCRHGAEMFLRLCVT